MTKEGRKYQKVPMCAVVRDAPSDKFCCSREELSPIPAKTSSIQHSFPSNEKSDQKDEKKISQYPLQCPSSSKKKKCSSVSFEDNQSFISLEDDEDDLSFISFEDDEDDQSSISFEDDEDDQSSISFEDDEDDLSFISFEDDDKHNEPRDYVNLNTCNVDGKGASTCCEKSVSKETSPPKKRVQFADSPQLVTVYLIIAWDYAYRAARVSPWMMMARDSQRFKRKIQSLEPILNPVLNPEHRAKIWATRMLNEE